MEVGGGAKGSKDTEVLAAHTKDAKGKGKGKGSLGSNRLETMTMEMAKLLLSHDEPINQLEAITIKTWLLPKTSVPMAAGKMEGQEYHEKVQPATKEELAQLAMGPPHIYVALAVLSSLKDIHTEDTPQRTQLLAMIKSLEDSNPTECARQIPMLKISKTYEELFKVRFHCQSPRDSLCLCSFFQKEGGQEKVGKAPRGRLAREVQKNLERK